MQLSCQINCLECVIIVHPIVLRFLCFAISFFLGSFYGWLYFMSWVGLGAVETLLLIWGKGMVHIKFKRVSSIYIYFDSYFSSFYTYLGYWEFVIFCIRAMTFLVASRSWVLCGISVYCCIRYYLRLVVSGYFVYSNYEDGLEYSMELYHVLKNNYLETLWITFASFCHQLSLLW